MFVPLSSPLQSLQLLNELILSPHCPVSPFELCVLPLNATKQNRYLIERAVSNDIIHVAIIL